MSKKSGFLMRLEAENKNRADYQRRRVTMITRQQTLDVVTITLGRMGFNPDDLEHFRDVYLETERDFCETVVTDGNDDADMWYSKQKIDDAIREYVKPEMFQDYDARYGV